MHQQILQKNFENSNQAQNVSRIQHKKSQFIESYINYLEDHLPLLCSLESQSLFAKEGNQYYSSQQGIIENQQTDKSYDCHMDIQLNNSQIMVFSIRASNFSLKLTLLNVKGNNPLLKYQQQKCGNFGKVYYRTFFDEVMALKIFHFSDIVHTSYYINKALKEYAFMKICSSLGCAPYLNNLLGFDLIVYDDSVMFSMEKCSEITKMKLATVKNLKYNLKLMHHHQIIHFDIKPDNIIFSPHFMKPVFIDFGFTQIVQQKLGVKTLTMFRGSPAFCSEEMTKIIGDEFFSYIDVYFNDLHCLKLSIKHMSSSNSFYDNQELIASDNDPKVYEKQMQINFMVCLLKHKFLTHQTEGIIKLLKYNNCLLLKQNKDQIFRLFEKSVPSHMFEHIYGSLKKDFNKFLDQSIIQSFYKYRYKKFDSWKISSEQANEQIQKTIFSHRLNADSMIPSLNHMEKYKEFLLMENIFCNPNYEEQSKYILIQTLRFDRKNNSLNEKISLSNKFNEVNGVESQLNLNSIKTTFQLLFGYCLALPRTNWKKQQIFIVLTQLLMLDMNLQPQLQQLFISLLQMHTTVMDEIRCSIQLKKFIYLQTFKHRSEHECMKQSVPQKISAFGNKLMKKVIELHSNSENEQIRYIVSAMRSNISSTGVQSKPSDFYGIMKKLKHIKDSFKHELIEFLYFQSFQINSFQQNHQSTYELLQNTKEFSLYQVIQSKKDSFHYSAYYLVRILAGMKNFQESQKFLENIIETINCEEISSKFKFEMGIFAFSDNLNTSKLQRFALELLECSSLVTVKLKAEFAGILEKIKMNQEFKKHHHTIIHRLCQSFSLMIKNLKCKDYILSNAQMEKIMYKLHLISFYFELSPNFQLQFFDSLIQEEQKKLLSMEGVSNQKMIFLKFHLEIYRLAYFEKLRQSNKVLQSLETMFYIAKSVHNQFYESYFLKGMIMNAIKISDKKNIREYVYMFYQISKTAKSLSQYFQDGIRKFIAITLFEFGKNRDFDEFYNFLVSLSKFITQFPYAQNVMLWHQNMQTLMKLKKYLDLMRYQALSRWINGSYWNNRYFIFYFIYSLKTQKNQYLKREIIVKIVKNIGYLSNYAKEIILKKCFACIIQHFQYSNRKMNSLILRWGFRYLQKSQFFKFFKKNIKKLRKSHYIEQITSSIRKKIRAALEN